VASGRTAPWNDPKRRMVETGRAGPCIVAGVIVAAGLGVEAWFLGVALVLVAFVLTGTGLLLGLVRLANRRSPTLPT